MKTFKVTMLIGICLFSLHLLYVFIWSWFKTLSVVSSLQSVIGVGAYMVFYALWAYFLFSYMYVVLERRMRSALRYKLMLAFVLMILAYILSRTGDIIDGDFIERFDVLTLIVFLLTSPFLVAFQKFLAKSKH